MSELITNINDTVDISSVITVPIDDSLSVSGEAADAKAVGDALALKSIRRMQNVRRFTADGAVSVRVFASNDLSVWSELQSLRCMPWKYFRLLFDFSRLKATDRFAGTVIVTQERRTNKLR